MQDVVISREKIVIPTYEHAPAEKAPMFFELRNNQSTRGNVYPYPMIDKLTDNLIDKEYDSIRIENEYVRVVALPELGGRIYEGYDKSADYYFVYKNNVIKPALIGLCGAWVSGGIEFNWPQHHRPTTFFPVDATVEENADGSKTAWMGEIELLSGTKGMVGITVYPGKAYIQAKARIYNRTPSVQTFHWWANLAVHTNDDYKLMFPPDIDYITTHYKPGVTTFPKLSGEYLGHDYGGDGPDVTWYRNATQSASYFIFNSNYSFMGGYDYSKQKGTVHVADRNVSPGKKFFTWGLTEFGQAWQKNLTDSDGPYLEIMTGCYTDNQPDFAFLHPYETKTFTQNWYGLNSMPNLVNASIDGAISLSVKNGIAEFALNSTSERKGAKAVLSAAGRTLYEKVIDISPAKPWKNTISLEDGVDPDCVEAAFYDAGGELLISYKKQPMFFDGKEAPKAHPAGRKPEDIPTIEELYLEGLQVEQYRHPTWDPEPFYLEALRRDPGDARCNNAMGVRYFKQADYAKAAEYFERAVKRLIMRNPNPYDSEPYFNLGVALRQLGKERDAREALKKAAWSYAWRAPALEQSAAIAMRAGDWAGALGDAEEALKTNSQSMRLRLIISAALRKLGRKDEAARLCGESAALDRLDYGARYERYILTGNQAELDALRQIMAGRAVSWLALAADYLDLGLYGEALAVLGECPPSPMKHYYAAYAYAYASNALGAKGGRGGKGQEAPAALAQAKDELPGWKLAKQEAGEQAKGSGGAAATQEAGGAGAGAGAGAAAAAAPLGAQGAAGPVPADMAQVMKELASAEQSNFDYCFPSTAADITVLEFARAKGSGGLVPYLLGLIYYARHNNARAIECFEEAARLRNGLHAAHRMLAYAYHDKRRDYAGARREMEIAFAQNKCARYLLELNQLYKVLGVSAAERLKLFNDNIGLAAERDDLYTAYIILLNLNGQSELAAEKLANHIFHPYEGGEGILIGEHIRTYAALGSKAFAGADYGKALKLFKAALEYPSNYNEGRRPVVFQSLVFYKVAMTYKAMGNADGYAEWLEKACGVGMESDEPGYYKGLALREAGKASEAQELYGRMLAAADQLDALGDSFPYFTGFPIGLAFEMSKLYANRVKSRLTRYYAYRGLGRAAETAAAKAALDELGCFYIFDD